MEIEELQDDLSSKFRSKLFRNQARKNSKLTVKVRNPAMKVKLEDDMSFLREYALNRRELGKRMPPNS